MKRTIYKHLLSWKNNPLRKPLIVRGARQTGKTYIIREFGHNEFENLVEVNFERNPEFKELFNTFDPKLIVEKLEIFLNTEIIPNKTLLFFDEVQECPKAIMALRYFYEEMPQLHVISAGSLLEFALNSEDFRMPVGRVQFMYMYPMSFGEFLDAIGQKKLHKFISDLNNIKNIDSALHQRLIELVRKYFLIGGMPAVVKTYIETQSILKTQEVQHSLLETFIADFAKYAKTSKHKYLQKVFYAVPRILSQKVVYAKIDKQTKSRDLKQAIFLLENAEIVRRVRRTSGAGLPFEATANDDVYKLIFIDIGLVHSLAGIYTETVQATDLTDVYRGALAEQFVGQELLANSQTQVRTNLFYWAREKKGSSAEVDYLWVKDSRIIPIEVKSGSIGKLKSLRMFLETYKPPYGLKISQSPYTELNSVISLPFYGIEAFVKGKISH